MRRIPASEYRRMPWKNGGGVTNEILVEPTSDDPSRYRWRLSIAEVASDGPFSKFEGYDRHIMVLTGNGMHLDCGAHGRITLLPNQPQLFSGDWTVTGTLIDGPVTDFNFIVERGPWRATLEVVSTPGWVYGPNTCIMHILAGPDAGDTFVASGAIEVSSGVTAAIVRLFHS